MRNKNSSYSSHSHSSLPPIMMASNEALAAKPPMDLTRLALVANSDAQKQAMMHLFFDHAEELVKKLRQYSIEDNYIHWEHAAHSLSGASANLGMHYLVEACKQAENAAHDHDEMYHYYLQHIEEEIEVIKDYISAHHPHWVPDQ